MERGWHHQHLTTPPRNQPVPPRTTEANHWRICSDVAGRGDPCADEYMPALAIWLGHAPQWLVRCGDCGRRKPLPRLELDACAIQNIEWHDLRNHATTMSAGPMEVCLGRQGRLVIPAALRRSLGLAEGDTLVARQEHGRLVLEKPETIKERLRARFAKVPADRRLVDELLAERRLDAQRESS